MNKSAYDRFQRTPFQTTRINCKETAQTKVGSVVHTYNSVGGPATPAGEVLAAPHATHVAAPVAAAALRRVPRAVAHGGPSPLAWRSNYVV